VMARRSSALVLFACVAVDASLTLHAYEHCQFCTRTRFVLGWAGVSYTPNFYGYGDGADPEKNGGFGYNPVSGGPIPLTGKKSLPVLEGAGVPIRDGNKGLAESMEICSYAVALGSGKVSPATGRKDVSDWLTRVGDTRKALERPRLIQMPVADFGDPRDIAYSKYTHTKQGFDYEQALADTPALIAELTPLLLELDTMLRGTEPDSPSLNTWGLGMDDAILLPILRAMTVTKDVEWPERVRLYLDSACAKANVDTFDAYAI